MALLAKDIDLQKVRSVRITKKPQVLYHKVNKKHRLLNQINPSDLPTLDNDESEPILIKSPKSTKTRVVIQDDLVSSKPTKPSKQTKPLKVDTENVEKHEKPEKSKNIEKHEKHDKQLNKNDIDNSDLKDTKDYIIREVDHLEYQHRKEILNMIIENGHQELVSESSDGSRIDMAQLPVELINQIKNFVSHKLETIDITGDFGKYMSENTESEKQVDNTKSSNSAKTQKTPKSKKNNIKNKS